MSEQQRLSVSYGSFSCDIVGFQDPLPVLQDVIGEFRQIAWRYPGFGAQKDLAQRDRLSRLVASKLNAALTGNGVSVTVNPDDGGLLVQPVGGAEKGEGWGDLYAKPKPGESPRNSNVRHPAAPVAEAATAPVAANAAAEQEDASDAAPAARPHLEIVAKVAKDAAEPADADAPVEVAEAGEPPQVAAAPVETPPEKPVEASASKEEIAPPAPEPIDPPAAMDEPQAPAAETKPPAPAAETETPAAEPAPARAPAVAAAETETPAAQSASTAEAPARDPDSAEETVIAAQVREEVEAIVTTEIKDAFDELKGSESAASRPATAGIAKSDPDDGTSRGGLFSRLLGAKKSPPRADAEPGALRLSQAESVSPPKKSPEKSKVATEDEALEEAFQSIARQLNDVDKKPAKPADKDISEDFVFSPDKPASDEALLLSADKALDPDEAADALAAEERVARAKAKVMERAKERQAAEAAATERRLRIIRRERVEEKSEEMKSAVTSAATGAPAMSAEDFAKLAGAASLQELMEASAAYATLVGGKHKFTRNDLMEVMSELDKKKAYSHEALLKSFGKMLRTGVLLRVDDGLFAMSVNHRYPYEMKIHA